MKQLTKISLVCYLLIALIELRVAFRFLTASQIMDYHQVAMGTGWDNLSIGMQTMTLNFLRAAGLGFLVTGIFFGFVLAIPFRKGEPWSHWALTSIGLIQAAIMGWIILSVRMHTPALPPFAPFVISAVLSLIGFVLYRGGLGRAEFKR